MPVKPRPLLYFLIGTVLLFLGRESAPAGTFTVTNLNGSGAGSLRDAITQANSAGGDDDIVFAGGVSGVIFLQSPLPNLSTNINIQGPGARILAVRGGGSRIFSCTGGTSTISGLTIAFGSVAGSGGATAVGGGIFNQATLTLLQCAIKYNSVQGGDGLTGAKNGGHGSGGGVYNSGVLELEGCTLSGNFARGGGGAAGTQGAEGGNGGAGNGGAIFNNAGATVTLTNCTVSGNAAVGGPGGSGNRGAAGGSGGAGYGGIYGNGTLTLTASTVSGNTGTGGAGGAGPPNGTAGAATGGIRNQGTATVRNLISAGNTGGDVSGTFISQGYNLIGPLGTATGFAATGDQPGVTNPNLGPLQDNDGTTDTMALAINSPALDKGKSFGLPFDQRGHLRPADSLSTANATGGDGTDIGAFEFHPLNGAVNECDGMSDDFESFYAVSNPNADSDGDGMTDAQEYQAGTNPRDAKSTLRIIAVAKSGNDFTLTFSLAVVGKAYRLERKLNLTDATWQSAGVPILTPDASGPAQLTVPNAISLGKAFYRPCTPGAPGCGWQAGEMETGGQNAWGDSAAALGPFLENNFRLRYPAGDLIIGGIQTARFTDSPSVFLYFPDTSGASVLAHNYIDPVSTEAGELGAEVLALQLNTDFSAQLGNSVPLASLRICNLTAFPALNGQTVAQFQATANHLLGGGSATISPAATAAIARLINHAFLDGAPSAFAQENLFVGPCPCTP